MPNIPTPAQVAELLEAAKRAREGCGNEYRALILPVTYELDDENNVNYYRLAANQSEGLALLVKEAMKVVRAASKWQDAGGLGGNGQAYDLHQKLRAFRSGPCGAWLEEGADAKK